VQYVSDITNARPRSAKPPSGGFRLRRLDRDGKVQCRRGKCARHHAAATPVSQVTARVNSSRQYALKRNDHVALQMELRMRTTEATTFATDRGALVLRLLDKLAAAVRRYMAYRQRQADLAILSGMTERELRDIGINRGDIERITT
jgi:uncharacterized protein YjiS (DUF1127 family)